MKISHSLCSLNFKNKNYIEGAKFTEGSVVDLQSLSH
jgi:hypothetical protein